MYHNWWSRHLHFQWEHTKQTHTHCLRWENKKMRREHESASLNVNFSYDLWPPKLKLSILEMHFGNFDTLVCASLYSFLQMTWKAIRCVTDFFFIVFRFAIAQSARNKPSKKSWHVNSWKVFLNHNQVFALINVPESYCTGESHRNNAIFLHPFVSKCNKRESQTKSYVSEY